MTPLALAILAFGCSSPESAPMVNSFDMELEAIDEDAGSRLSSSSPPPPPKDGAAAGYAAAEVGGMELSQRSSSRSEREEGRVGKKRAPGEDRDDVQTRAWFPEAFLWRPLVETGEDGVAEIEVRVPDQLSTFRVLALAHDRRGQQAGDVHTFQSRLPVHVDPLVPDRLYLGDRVSLPVRVVNGSDGPLEAALNVAATGALSGGGDAELTLSAGSSDVRRIALVAARPGTASVRAEVVAGEHADAAERTMDVLPSGRPVVSSVARRLSSDPFTLVAARGANPASERIEVTVLGGAWSLLHAEVERLAAGARPLDPAYGYTLSAHVTALAEATGVEVDDELQRRLRIQAWQRLARRARSPTAGEAADLLASLRGVEGDELVDALMPELVRLTRRRQRANGTWSRTEVSTLQQVLVQTAVAARALPDDERGARVRAAGAVERSLSSIADPYTASVVLAADLVPTLQREALRDMVRGAVEEGRVVVPETVRNARGERPTPSEARAWAILALEDDDPVGGLLVAELLGAWRVERGFGAGAADAVALEAVVRSLPPPDEPVSLELRSGQEAVATATLDPADPRVPARFVLTPEASTTTLSLHADPPAPGLVMVATRRSWVDWRATDRVPGVDVDVDVETLRVGQRGHLRLAIAGPSKAVVRVRQPLPAGVTVLAAPLAGRATVELFSDEIVVRTAAFQPGEAIEVDVPVVATFPGRFSTGPLTVSVDAGPETPLRPELWRVRE